MMSLIDEEYIKKFVDEMCGSRPVDRLKHEHEVFLAEVESLPPHEIASLLSQVLEQPSMWLDGRSIDELGLFQDNLFSHVNGFWGAIRGKRAPLEQQIQAVNALKPYFTFLDPYCDENGSNPALGTNNLNRLDGAVYMTWDKGTLEGAATCPGEEHLVEPILSTIEHMLTLGSCAMQLGGLHGLGHMAEDHEQRVQKSIDGYLAGGNVRMPWLIGYAGSARSGEVL